MGSPQKSQPWSELAAGGLIASVVLGLVLMAVAKVTFNLGRSLPDTLIGMTALAGPGVLFYLVWRYSGLERRAYLSDLDGHLQRLKSSIEAESANPRRLGLGQRRNALQRQYELAVRCTPPTHPTLLEIHALYDALERDDLSGRDLGQTTPGPGPGGELADLFLRGRAPQDHAARALCVVGLILVSVGAMPGKGWFQLGGVLLQWFGFVMLLRRFSVIVSVGGGFILSCFGLIAAWGLANAISLIWKW